MALVDTSILEQRRQRRRRQEVKRNRKPVRKGQLLLKGWPMDFSLEIAADLINGVKAMKAPMMG